MVTEHRGRGVTTGDKVGLVTDNIVWRDSVTHHQDTEGEIWVSQPAGIVLSWGLTNKQLLFNVQIQGRRQSLDKMF